MRPDFTVLHITDHHIPSMDRKLGRLSVQAVAQIAPSALVLGGDMMDMYRLSRFRQRADRFYSVQEEFDLCGQLIDAYHNASRRSAIHYTLGNHEDRVTKYVDSQAPALATLRSLKLSTLLSEQPLTMYPYGEGPSFGGILFTHGTTVRKWAGNSVREEIRNHGTSVCMGHVHRDATVTLTQGGRTLYGYETGCLQVNPPPYKYTSQDWTHSISLFLFYGARRDVHYRIPLYLDRPRPFEILGSVGL